MNEIILLTITTSIGNFDIELYQKEAPITANNFVEYVEQNFYENTLFHRVIPGFVIQGGGFEIGMSPKETNPPIKNEADNGLKNDKYTLSMARTQDLDSATSQFFINLTDNKSLDYPSMGGYAVFGKVISGEEIIDKIAEVRTTNVGPYQDVPIEDVYIIKVEKKKMSSCFIYDIHLHEKRKDIKNSFFNFLESEATRFENLYILGDLFEVWIGDDLEDEFSKEVIRSLSGFLM